jgi:hypothetical protein
MSDVERFLDVATARNAMRVTALTVVAAFARHNIAHFISGSLDVETWDALQAEK